MGETIDVGEFARLLHRAAELGDAAGFAARRAAQRRKRPAARLGLAYYVEAILGDTSENAALEFTAVGGVRLSVGTQSNGQRHETVYAPVSPNDRDRGEDRIEIVRRRQPTVSLRRRHGWSRSTEVRCNRRRTLPDDHARWSLVLAVPDRAQPARGVALERHFAPRHQQADILLHRAAKLAREAGRKSSLCAIGP